MWIELRKQLYNGNIKCYTLDGEVVKCLIVRSDSTIEQNCIKGNRSICNLIADEDHTIRKILQIENNIREEIAKNEER